MLDSANEPGVKPGSLKLVNGQSPIDFQVTDINGKVIKLKDFKGKKILITFFRSALCPFCSVRYMKLATMKPSYKDKGLEVISFFESAPEKLKRAPYSTSSEMIIISDEKKEIYDKYGIEKSWIKMLRGLPAIPGVIRQAKELNIDGTGKEKSTMNLITADFLITPDFKVHKAHYGSFLGDHIAFEEIDNFCLSN